MYLGIDFNIKTWYTPVKEINKELNMGVPITCINKYSIDKEYDGKHGGPKFWWLRFATGSFLVYKEYPSFCEQDALDLFADWAVDNAPGYIPTEDYIFELQADARKDGKDEDEHVSDFFTPAGNAGHWVDIPTLIEEVTEKELIDNEFCVA